MIDRLELHAYADGELPAEDAARLESLLASDPDAKRELDAILRLKRCLKATPAPQFDRSVWMSCVSRLNELDRVHKAETFVSKYAWGLCALLFLVIMGGGMLSRYRGGAVGMGTVASMSSDLIPIQTPRLSQPDQLRSWITDQTGQQPSMAPDPARVVGMAYADRPEGRIVQLRMADNRGFVLVMVIPHVNRVEGVRPIGNGMYAGQLNGLNCVTWPDSGCAVVVIGDRDHEQLCEFARSLYR